MDKAKANETPTKCKVDSSSEDSSSFWEDSISEDYAPLKKQKTSGGASSKKSNASSPSKKPSAGGGSKKKYSDKEWLIERFLVRWWYVEDWPPADRPRPNDLPSDDFVEMEHYPYIYFNENTGQVINKRTKDNLPPCKEVYPYIFTRLRPKIVFAGMRQKQQMLRSLLNSAPMSWSAPNAMPVVPLNLVLTRSRSPTSRSSTPILSSRLSLVTIECRE